MNYRRCFAVACCLLLLACQRDELRLERKNFEEEVSLRQHLTFTFNRPVVADSLLNRWDTTAYVRFTPDVPGRFRWTAPDALTFAPERGFAPSTTYEGQVTKALRRYLTRGTGLDQTPFSFHTPFLTAAGTSVFWTRADDGQVVARAELRFNYPVAPQQVASRLRVTTDGQPLDFRVVSTRPAATLTVDVLPGTQALAERPLVFTVAKGLTTPASDYQTPEPLELATTVPAKDRFMVVHVDTDFDGAKGTIRVQTNQAVADGDLSAFVDVKPRVAVTVETEPQGFVLRGDFEPEREYTLSLAASLKGIFGYDLGQPYTQTVRFGQPAPEVAFTDARSLYLSSQGQRNIGLRVRGVPKVRVRVHRIYANNLQHFLRSQGRFGRYYREEDYYSPYRDYTPFGDLIEDREISVRNLLREDDHYLLNMSWPSAGERGVYAVDVSDPSETWRGASKIVVVSDVGLIVKEGEEEVWVLANSILTAEPEAGVRVRLLSGNNQTVQEATTNSEGIAKFKLSAPPGTVGGRPNVRMVTATRPEDFTYLTFAGNQVETSRYDVGGLRGNPAGYLAYLYGERDLYRPGETMHFNAVVRTEAWRNVSGEPVRLRVVQPNGRELTARRGELNDAGAFAASVPLPAAALTGTYQVELLSGSDVLLQSIAVSVEEFMPDRLKVQLRLSADTLAAGESLVASLGATNLYGPPAANRRYEAELTLASRPFRPAGYENFDFSLSGEAASLPTVVREGQTDAAGEATERFEIPEALGGNGLLDARVFTTVFDESGRPVNRVARAVAVTQSAFFGVGPFDRYPDLRRPVRIPLVALNTVGQPAAARATVQVLRYDWQTVLERHQGQYRYVSRKQERVLREEQVDLRGRGEISFVPTLSGEYEVRVRAEGGERYVRRRFYAYGEGYTQYSSFEVNREGQVTIEADREAYAPNDVAKLLFKTPFAGRLLVTVERDRVIEHFTLDTDKRAARLTLPVRADFAPNVYVTATLFRPNADPAGPLTVAHGAVPLRVTRPDTRLPVSIEAPPTSRSQRSQTVKIKTEPNAEVTLAVVDEGILQIKNYASPDPHDFFYQQRALEVASYDLYARLLPERAGRALSSTGGGDGFDLSRRVNPLTGRRVRLVTYWSGPLRADRRGEVTCEFDIPEFSGALRLMAVAYRQDAFGAASQPMRVADPLVVTTGLPRFLSPGDSLPLVATISNTTDREAQARVSLRTNALLGELQVAQTVTVPAGREARVRFPVQAGDALGTAEATVAVSAFGETFQSRTTLPVRPPSALVKRAASGTIAAGQTKALPPAGAYAAGTAEHHLLLSNSPVAALGQPLAELLRYPYGCTEQVVSAAFPQLYFADLADVLRAPAVGGQANPAYHVQQAILQLQSRQIYDGSLAYWPGTTHRNWWTSAYAAHFLLEAREAGHDVQPEVLSRLLDFLARRVKEKETAPYAYFASGQRRTRPIAPRALAYSLYVLATAQRPDVPTMNYYRSRPELLSLDARYALATSYLLAGDETTYRQLLPKDIASEKAVAVSGGSFYSYLRDQAFALNALVSHDPDHPQVALLARRLADQLREAQYRSTQENAFALLALGTLARRDRASRTTAVVRAGKEQIGAFRGRPLYLELSTPPVDIEVAGSGQLYYFQESSGIALGPVAEEDQVLRVRRTYLDRNGQPLTTIRQNDLLVVKITLRTLDGARVSNVVVTDLLPGGFEPENSRLNPTVALPWIKQQFQPDYVDFRDDRVHFFTDASGRTQTFYYTVRAVTPGTYRLGPVSADAMYRGEYHSYHGAGIVRVLP